MSNNKKIAIIVGTRPGIIMMAPIIRQLRKQQVPHFVVHTGQHFSPAMDTQLFEDLELNKPEFHLENTTGASTHAEQTARMMVGCEKIFLQENPKLVLVNGDANTNLAAALTARKIGVSVAHSEAGERSFDWSMPEEHNRRIIDHISDLLFPTGELGKTRLETENCQGKIVITGNTIVDASLFAASVANNSKIVLNRLGLEREKFVLVTSHREENVDDAAKLRTILNAAEIANKITGLRVIFPLHPRTKKMISTFKLQDVADRLNGVEFIEPLRYLEFTELLTNCRLVLTDSGGVQQEAYIHKRQCVTMRENTEWLQTLDNDANRLAGALDLDRISNAIASAHSSQTEHWPEIFGDGTASKRIVDEMVKHKQN